SEQRRNYIRAHYAIRETVDGDGRRHATLLISSNSAIFRISALRHVQPRVRALLREGGFDTTLEKNRPEGRRVDHFWGIDPKTHETKTLAWNYIRLIASEALAMNQPIRIGFAYVGNAPSSIKDAVRQFKFADNAPASWRLPYRASLSVLNETERLAHLAI